MCKNEHILRDSRAEYYLSLPNNRTVVRCKRCGLRWLRPMPTEEEYREFYKLYFDCLPEDYDQVVQGRLPCYRDRIERLKNLLGCNDFSILDIGAGTGEFVFEAQRAGLRPTGIELSAEACQKAFQKYGLHLINGDLSLLSRQENFDVVHMHHVFEHLVQPLEMLNELERVLSPDGYLVIEVPYQFDNWMEIIQKALLRGKPRPYSVYSIHHPFFYSPSAIKNLLSRRLEIVSLITRTGIQSPSFMGKLSILIGDKLLNRGGTVEVIARKYKI